MLIYIFIYIVCVHTYSSVRETWLLIINDMKMKIYTVL